jgi:hypothetical protein
MDKAYIDGIKHMFEGKIYECNGTNGRQGVAIMVSNECKEKATKYSIHYYLLLSVT